MKKVHLLILLCPILLTACAGYDNRSYGNRSYEKGNYDAENNDLRRITILYTNDEHGWIEGMESDQSAAHLYALWQAKEGYREDGPFLVLSGGDNWTGPAISTWTQGKSTVEVMNAMHYDASAVGNHEFDFGLEVLKARADEANYPYLSANTRWRSNGKTPEDIGILPYTIATVNGLSVGIIGLTTLETRTATNPNNVSELDFIDYESALRETLPVVQSQNTDLNLVIAHVCVEPLDRLIRRIQDLDIAMIGAGHCNELIATRVNDTVLVGGGYHFTSYATAKFTVDVTSGTIVERSFATNVTEYENADAAVEAIVSGWAEKSEAILSEELAYTDRELGRYGGELGRAIVKSWLIADPSADIAITNEGGIRMGLPQGTVDVGMIVALMPFDNTIIATELDGAAVRTALETGIDPVIGGLSRQGDRWILSNSGKALEDDKKYRVLVNSFMYDGGDGYNIVAETDPDGFDTGMNYRQPFQDWLEAQNSSEDNPVVFE